MGKPSHPKKVKTEETSVNATEGELDEAQAGGGKREAALRARERLCGKEG